MPPAASADNQALADWNALFDRHNEVACLMLGTMSPKLYQQFENKSPQEMITELQKMYGKPPGVELQELVNMFHSCKKAEGQSVSDHVLLMKSYLDQLATLKYAFPDKVSISFILNSLSSEFQAFVQNYNMQSMEKTISECRVQKNKPQGKAKRKEKGNGLKNSYPTKPKKPQPYKKERPAKDGQCHHCKEEGHWKRNCHVYLAELMKKKKIGGQNVASTSSGIYTIELFAITTPQPATHHPTSSSPSQPPLTPPDPSSEQPPSPTSPAAISHLYHRHLRDHLRHLYATPHHRSTPTSSTPPRCHATYISAANPTPPPFGLPDITTSTPPHRRQPTHVVAAATAANHSHPMGAFGVVYKLPQGCVWFGGQQPPKGVVACCDLTAPHKGAFGSAFKGVFVWLFSSLMGVFGYGYNLPLGAFGSVVNCP
ncbi:zinc finger, CCHC-type containing protein [Tanacetum coccineum]